MGKPQVCNVDIGNKEVSRTSVAGFCTVAMLSRRMYGESTAGNMKRLSLMFVSGFGVTMSLNYFFNFYLSSAVLGEIQNS